MTEKYIFKEYFRVNLEKESVRKARVEARLRRLVSQRGSQEAIGPRKATIPKQLILGVLFRRRAAQF